MTDPKDAEGERMAEGMVAAVALAIYEATPRNKPWGKLSAWARTEWRARAVAAIKAVEQRSRRAAALAELAALDGETM